VADLETDGGCLDRSWKYRAALSVIHMRTTTRLAITVRLASTAVHFSWIWRADSYESGARAAFQLSTETVTSTDRVPCISDFHRIPTKHKFHLELLSDKS